LASGPEGFPQGAFYSIPIDCGAQPLGHGVADSRTLDGLNGSGPWALEIV
jgi:hypothetical protein